MSKANSDPNKYLMDQDEFVKGKRLIDPVTGRVEGTEKEELIDN